MTDDTVRPETDPPRETDQISQEDEVVDRPVTESPSPDAPATEPVDSAATEVEADPFDSVATSNGDGGAIDGDGTQEATIVEPPETEEETVGPLEGTIAESPETEVEPGAPVEDATEPLPEAVPALESEAAEKDADFDSELVIEEGAAAPDAVTSSPVASHAGRHDVFAWHPEYKGKSFDEVRAALAQEIAADQRQHQLAMEGAEESEHAALTSVVSLERKWGPYDFDWAEQEPDELADRIVAFERERERRQKMISWKDYRSGNLEVVEAQEIGERAPELSTPAKGLSLLLVVLLIVVILLAVWAL